MYFLYNMVLRLITLLFFPVGIVLLLFIPTWRKGIWARLGFYSRAEREVFAALPRPRVWFHAASVGELSAVAPIAAALKERISACSLVVSTMTQNGLSLATQKIQTAGRVFLAPLDYRGAVRRALRMIEPDLVVIAETELWPNWLRESKRRGCQLALVNGRMSERTFPRYWRLRLLLRRMLDYFDLLAVQSEADAQRYCRLGANFQRVKITGNTPRSVFRPSRRGNWHLVWG